MQANEGDQSAERERPISKKILTAQLTFNKKSIVWSVLQDMDPFACLLSRQRPVKSAFCEGEARVEKRNPWWNIAGSAK